MEDRRHSERRNSPHEDCTAHSGMASKLNVNLILNGLGVFLLTVLLSLLIDTHAAVKMSSYRMEKLERIAEDHGERLVALERSR